VDALAEYDASEADRESLFNGITDENSFNAWQSAQNLALEKVQEAFFQVTSNINSREHCRLVDVQFCRKVAAIGTLTHRAREID
jgi:hypothetical protein